MKRTYEELEAELAIVQTELVKTQGLLKIALEEISKLQERIGRNSKNSSKSPSTDQKSNTPQDQNSRKKRKGRKGKARAPFPKERVDRHVTCTQENCPHCGSKAIQLNGASPEIWQQAELPEVKAIITEYQLQRYSCDSCGKNSTANLPAGVPHSAFGPKLMGLLAVLTGVFHLAKREATQLIKDLYDVDVGLGSVPNIEERVTSALEPVYNRIHHFVIEGKLCKHFDETGWRDSGKRHYVWLGCCEHAAVYMIDRNRSSEAFQRLVRKDLKDTPVVTDRYAVYKKLGKVHQYCLAHLIREFQHYAERDGPDKELGKALKEGLSTACHIHGKYRKGEITMTQRNQRLGHLKRKVEVSLEDGMANGSEELYKLCESLLDDYDKLWTFTKVSGMEPTNNLAERDLRKLVIWRRKSYGTRSNRGKRFVERITTVAQTLKRGGHNVLRFIQQTIERAYRNMSAPFIFEAMGF